MPKTQTAKNAKVTISTGEETKILRRIVDLTSSELDLDLILKEIVKIVTEVVSADSVFIYLLDNENNTLVLLASKTPHSKELGKVNLKIGEGITGWVAKESKVVAIRQNAYKDKRFKNFDVLPEDEYEAFLSVPIVHKNKTIGVVNVQHIQPHDYSDSTLKLMDTVAKQVGGVIESSRMYSETKKKAVQFDSLAKVSQTITSERYLDEILNLIVVVTAEMLNSKVCSIMLLDDKGKELVIKATQSLSEEYTKKPNVTVQGSISGEVMATRKPIAIYDVRKEERYRFRDLAVKEDLTSMLAVPMIVKDRAIGIINVYTKKPHNFLPDEIGVLQMVANQAAVAVENTKLMEESLRAKEALETRKLVERAKGILMKMNDLSEDAAYKLIHKKSMDSCRSMKDIAESIILMDEFKKK